MAPTNTAGLVLGTDRHPQSRRVDIERVRERWREDIALGKAGGRLQSLYPHPHPSSSSGWPAVALAHKSEEVIHQRANGKNVVFIHSGSDNFQSNFIILLDDDVLIAGLVAGRVGIGIKFHF